MAKLFLASMLVAALVGSAHMQIDQQQPMRLPFGLGGQANGYPGGQSNGLLGSQSGGIFETLSQLPQRGAAMLNNLMSGVRNMLPGLGQNQRQNFMNGQQMPGMQNTPSMSQMPQNPLGNLMNGFGGGFGQQRNPMGQMMNQNSQGLTGPLTDTLRQLPQPVNGMVQPITDALQQGRMPDLNTLSQTISQTTNGLGGLGGRTNTPMQGSSSSSTFGSSSTPSMGPNV